MLKRTVVIFAAAAFFGGAVPTQTAQAGDDIWDLMNPSWWADEVFDNNNDDDWRYYRRHHYTPYWGGPGGGNRPLYVIVRQPETKKQYPEIKPPE